MVIVSYANPRFLSDGNSSIYGTDSRTLNCSINLLTSSGFRHCVRTKLQMCEPNSRCLISNNE